MARKILITVSDKEYRELLVAAGEFPLATWARVELIEAARESKEVLEMRTSLHARGLKPPEHSP